MSCWMSSSRLQTTFTGPSTCCAIRTARSRAVDSRRRPNPPPRRWLWMAPAPAFGSPVMSATTAWDRPAPGCRPRCRSRPCADGRCSSSAPSSRGPGTASDRCLDSAQRRRCAAAASPSWRATAPGCFDWRRRAAGRCRRVENSRSGRRPTDGSGCSEPLLGGPGVERDDGDRIVEPDDLA